MRSARNLYRLNLLVAALGATALLAVAAAAVSAANVAAPSTADLVEACRRLLPQLGPRSLGVLAFAALAAGSILLGTRSAARQLGAYRRFRRRLEVCAERELAGTVVRVVTGARPEAFCAGLVRPRIHISQAALAVLTEDELGAVIAHEVHHARRRDPLRIFVVAVLADALFFLPALRRLKARYEELAELAADDAAVGVSGDRAGLASALLAFGEQHGPGVVAIAPERVDNLLGEQTRWQLPVTAIAGALVTVLGLVTAAALLAAAPSGDQPHLALLAAQLCMITMTVAPLSMLVFAAVVARRRLARR